MNSFSDTHLRLIHAMCEEAKEDLQDYTNGVYKFVSTNAGKSLLAEYDQIQKIIESRIDINSLPIKQQE